MLNNLCKVSYITEICFSYLNFYVLANVLLGVGMLWGCMGAFPGKEGGVQVFAGLDPFS